MFRKFFVLAFIIVLSFASVEAQSLKNKLDEFGTGNEARVKVKLKNKTSVSGFVREVNENSFVVINERTNAAETIDYKSVKKIKGRNNLTGKDLLAAWGLIGVIAMIIFGAN